MNAYDAFTAEIRSMIAPAIKSDLDADRYARGIADEIDFTADTAHFEIRGMHTASGNPETFRINIPSELRETADE